MGMRPTVGRQCPYQDIGMSAGMSGMSGMNTFGSGAVMTGTQPVMVMGGQAVAVGNGLQQHPLTRFRRSTGQPLMVAGAMPRMSMPVGTSSGLIKGPIPIQVSQPRQVMFQQPQQFVVQQPRMVAVQQPVQYVQQPQMVVQQPRMIVQQPRVQYVQQPRMQMISQPRVQMIPQSGVQVQNLGTTVNDYQVSPYVTERHIVQQTKKIIRKTRKPVRKQIGTKMVPTVEEVEVQNPDTMKMATEYAEPYIKRDGFETENVGTIGRAKVVRRSGKSRTVTRRTSAPIFTNQVTTTGRIGMRRGYTRIDTWKHVGDAQRH